jgi:hypothetical protein
MQGSGLIATIGMSLQSMLAYYLFAHVVLHVDKCREQAQPFYMAFIHLIKALDSVSRKGQFIFFQLI